MNYLFCLRLQDSRFLPRRIPEDFRDYSGLLLSGKTLQVKGSLSVPVRIERYFLVTYFLSGGAADFKWYFTLEVPILRRL